MEKKKNSRIVWSIFGGTILIQVMRACAACEWQYIVQDWRGGLLKCLCCVYMPSSGYNNNIIMSVFLSRALFHVKHAHSAMADSQRPQKKRTRNPQFLEIIFTSQHQNDDGDITWIKETNPRRSKVKIPGKSKKDVRVHSSCTASWRDVKNVRVELVCTGLPLTPSQHCTHTHTHTHTHTRVLHRTCCRDCLYQLD